MDKKVASFLLASLLERIGRDQIGTVSGHEKAALEFALRILTDDQSGLILPLAESKLSDIHKINSQNEGEFNAPIVGSQSHVTSVPETKIESDKLPEVELVLDSLAYSEPTNPDVLLCLDFGTAMSKAFAARHAEDYLDLELGIAAGRHGHVLPSSVFITDDGKVYFGFEAIEHSDGLIESGRERLDSIKSWLSLRSEGDLDGQACVLTKAFNPSPHKLTQGDLIRIYLAYLVDMAEKSLMSRIHGAGKTYRYVKRRFARPCWSNEGQAIWADRLMRTLLAEAQILADTFHNQWQGGIEVSRLKAALNNLKELQSRPEYLVDMGIPEPVAVAAGAFADSENLRDAFMVVDVGAGTTDFGMFISTHNEELGVSKVFQVPASIYGLMQAGDKIDGLLRAYISRKEGISTGDTSGRLIEADLRRRIRLLKEQLFQRGKMEYALADGSIGSVELQEFLDDPTVTKFSAGIESGFLKSIEALDDSWLKWLSMNGVFLRVVLTGGSSRLPMMRALGHGYVEVRGYKINRKTVNPLPSWMDDSPEELVDLYPQLAVAIGGTAEEMPETFNAPLVFMGGTGRSTYVAGKLHVSGV